jgi:hypothetical protein
MIERTNLVNFRATDEERAKLKALADDEGEHASTLLRRWIRQRYDARFGEVAPSRAARKGA